MLIVLIIQTVLLALNQPLIDPDSVQHSIYKYLGFVLQSVFLLECVLKIMAFQLIQKPNPKCEIQFTPYLRDFWNVFDFSLVFLYLLN